MASRIQGITVEIGGDTTKLSKALESVNKSIKGTQSGLKDVNKLLKLDPSNTELVVQKQKMLKDAIEATKEKLATLKTAAQQANEQLANGEITQQQYDALQREIVETEQNLRSLQDQAATTNATLAKIDEAGEKLQNIGSSVENVGKKFLPVTAAVTGLGTAAVKTAADFDSEMSKVSAISGATGDDFDQLRAKAREMGAKTKFSASEAASAMEYMAMAGWKTGDMLNGIEGIMNLAAASGEDLATTSDIVTDALTAFGLSAADSGHFADILAAASSNANTNVSMMGETFKYCAPIAGALGFSAEDTAEAIGLMANSGIKASQAGTSLRTIMNNLSGEVTFVGKNIGEVTIATSNADGSMRSLNDILADCRVAFSGLSESEKAANAEALVGKNAMSGFLALMNSSEKDINKLRGAIENCDGASESMAETMLCFSFARFPFPHANAILRERQFCIKEPGLIHPVRDQNHRFVRHLSQIIQQSKGCCFVQCAGRLVQQKNWMVRMAVVLERSQHAQNVLVPDAVFFCNAVVTQNHIAVRAHFNDAVQHIRVRRPAVQYHIIFFAAFRAFWDYGKQVSALPEHRLHTYAPDAVGQKAIFRKAFFQGKFRHPAHQFFSGCPAPYPHPRPSQRGGHRTFCTWHPEWLPWWFRF